MKAQSHLFGPLIVTLIVSAVIAVFWPTFQDLLTIGPGDDELTHRILAVPIFFSLVWGLRFELAKLPVRCFWLGLAGMAGAGLVWLVGELTLVRLLTNTAVIVMVPMTVLTILGYRWVLALSFPLFYLLFAVPFRGPLVPLQVDWTARFTHMALLASGVPVHREGPYFELSTGTWSIADTCSGIEYLSACMMLGVLYAWTMYTSTLKRLAFVGGAVVVGICGNWLRAYLTIFIAHLSDNRYLRDGHGTFGWIMFATLLFVYCWIGWYFRDKESGKGSENPHSAEIPPPPPPATRLPFVPQMAIASAISLAALVTWPVIADSFSRARSTEQIAVSPVTAEAGWTKVARSPVDWIPTLVNPTRRDVQSFEKNGRHVDIFTGIFANQKWTSKLVTSVNYFVPAESTHWTLVNRGTEELTYLERPLQVKSGIILGGGNRIAARQWYWVHGVSTGDDVQAKIAQLRARLSGKDDISAWVTVYTVVNSSPELASGTLDAFMQEMGPALERALQMTSSRQ